jgi:hypothetical protein
MKKWLRTFGSIFPFRFLILFLLLFHFTPRPVDFFSRANGSPLGTDFASKRVRMSLILISYEVFTGWHGICSYSGERRRRSLDERDLG